MKRLFSTLVLSLLFVCQLVARQTNIIIGFPNSEEFRTYLKAILSLEQDSIVSDTPPDNYRKVLETSCPYSDCLQL